MRAQLRGLQLILSIVLMLAIGFVCAIEVDAKSKQLTEDMAQPIPAQIFTRINIAASEHLVEVQDEPAEAAPDSTDTTEELTVDQWHAFELPPLPDRIDLAPACTVSGEEIRKRYEAAADAAVLDGTTL